MGSNFYGTMNIAQKNSRIYFHSLHWDKNPDTPGTDIIYRLDTDDTIIIGEFESRLVRHLYEGKTVEETARAMDTTVDEVKKMVVYLLDYGFLKAVDTIKIPELSNKIHPLFLGVNRNWFRWVLNPYLFLFNCIIISSGFVFALAVPGFLPSVEDFLWTPDIPVAFLVNTIIQYGLIFIHECAHFAATKAIGGEASLSIGYQFIYLVAQTENYRIQSKPKHLRYIVYLAGIFADMLMIGLIYWFLLYAHLQNIPLGSIETLLKCVVLVLFSGICWQLNAYLETDIYYVISDYLNQQNLYEDAKKLFVSKVSGFRINGTRTIKKLLYFFTGENEKTSNDLRAFTKKQKQQLSVYIILFFTGITVTTVYYFLFIFYREVLYMQKGIEMFYNALYSSNFWDAVRAMGLIFLILYQYVLLLYLFIKRHKQFSLIQSITRGMHRNKGIVSSQTVSSKASS